MISDNERIGAQTTALDEAISSNRADIQTAMPGIIQSFNPSAVTCTVQPAIQGVIERRDGKNENVNLPLLLDCPVVFPHAGGCTLTFPIKPGDECLVVFGSRCIDAWWQSGGVQVPMEMRMHDLSDGFVIPGPMSQAKKIGGISTSAVQLRSDDGQAFIEINPSSHDILMETPANITFRANRITLDTPNVVNNGQLSSGGSKGVGATINGIVTITEDAVINDRSFNGHRHKDVEPGGGTSGVPV